MTMMTVVIESMMLMVVMKKKRGRLSRSDNCDGHCNIHGSVDECVGDDGDAVRLFFTCGVDVDIGISMWLQFWNCWCVVGVGFLICWY